MLIDASFSTNENTSSMKTDQSKTRAQYVSLGSVNNRNHMVRSENPTKLPRDSRDVGANCMEKDRKADKFKDPEIGYILP